MPFSAAAKAVQEATNKVLGAEEGKNPNTIYGDRAANWIPWTIIGGNWYKTFPYVFVVRLKSGSGPAGTKFYNYVMPIPPQQMITRMIPASDVTPTVGGVIEETSENVFWTIQMVGTTGTAVSRKVDSGIEANDVELAKSREGVAKTFRKRLQTTGLLAGIAANIEQTLGKVGNIADSVIGGVDAFKDGNFAGAASGVVGAINNLILPPQMFATSSVDEATNGYTEIQELHRFLLTFSRLKAGNPKGVSLSFQNHKTGQEWDIILQDFVIQQSAQNPNLYRYTIQMKCWNVKTPNSNLDIREVDRFAVDGDLAEVNTVGVKGIEKGLKGIKKNIFPGKIF